MTFFALFMSLSYTAGVIKEVNQLFTSSRLERSPCHPERSRGICRPYPERSRGICFPCHPERSRGICFPCHPERSRGICRLCPERSRGICYIGSLFVEKRNGKPLMLIKTHSLPFPFLFHALPRDLCHLMRRPAFLFGFLPVTLQAAALTHHSWN